MPQDHFGQICSQQEPCGGCNMQPCENNVRMRLVAISFSFRFTVNFLSIINKQKNNWMINYF